MSSKNQKMYLEEEIDWKDNIGQDGEDVVLKRVGHNSLVTRDDYLKLKVIDDLKELFLGLIPRGQIKVRYDLDMFDGPTVQSLELMKKCLKMSSGIFCDSKDDIYYIHLKRDGAKTASIFSIMVTWEVPIHKINTKSALLKSFESLERAAKYNGLKFEPIFNKSTFQVSTLVGLSLSTNLDQSNVKKAQTSIVKRENSR